MKDIIIATKNAGKAKEFKTFFAKYDVKAVSLLDLTESMEDVEETGSTFEENAALKAETISNRMNTPVLADDSGLMIDALDGHPGIYSARYAGEPKNDQANLEKVLDELDGVEDRTARFVCVLAVKIPGQDTFFKRGECEGNLTTEPKGENGFGYDPIFVPEGYTKTMAQLSAEEKNQISHRKHAIDKLEDWIKQQ
ncbi:XTP/dITP diphosphatase [Virgibacillus siamensis]|uniref:XTP/dITP diphosphatase n=1 Tax=Virgibacillus siamensis TaxID=480071 RepID=UPI000986FF66|nr:XTP/dITP diphosphatase [Virgibacillus siamensis]